MKQIVLSGTTSSLNSLASERTFRRNTETLSTRQRFQCVDLKEKEKREFNGHCFHTGWRIHGLKVVFSPFSDASSALKPIPPLYRVQEC